MKLVGRTECQRRSLSWPLVTSDTHKGMPEEAEHLRHDAAAAAAAAAENLRLAAKIADMARFPEMNPGPVLRLERDSIVVLANGAARRLFNDSEIQGSSWIEICPELTNDIWTQILASTATFAHEVSFDKKCVLFNYVQPEARDLVFAFGSDITALRDSERLVAEQARFPEMNPGPVIRTDIDGNVLLANAAARALLGEDVAGKCWPEVCPTLDERLWNEIVSSDSTIRIEASIGAQDFVFAHRADPGGRLIFVYGTDLSHQKQAERALRQSEKMATLGTLAAGVAHELNNPAAATRRAADQLRDALARLEAAHLSLAVVDLGDDQLVEMVALEKNCREFASQRSELDGLARSDREADIEDWLDDHGIDDPFTLAASLVGQRIDIPRLESLIAKFDSQAFAVMIEWTASAFPVYSLLHEIGQGSARLSEIVGALKGYSYLGQAPVGGIDIHEGIDNTLVILRSKLREGIEVIRNYGDDVPLIEAYGGELNQVWTNLLDNAADAITNFGDGSGTITISTRRDGEEVFVEILDDGPGIPAEALSRIFDPFFTTKEPGKGTGLGLSTSFSIITENHHGTIEVESRPAQTSFKVVLPIKSRTNLVGAASMQSEKRVEEQP